MVVLQQGWRCGQRDFLQPIMDPYIMTSYCRDAAIGWLINSNHPITYQIQSKSSLIVTGKETEVLIGLLHGYCVTAAAVSAAAAKLPMKTQQLGPDVPYQHRIRMTCCYCYWIIPGNSAYKYVVAKAIFHHSNYILLQLFKAIQHINMQQLRQYFAILIIYCCNHLRQFSI